MHHREATRDGELLGAVCCREAARQWRFGPGSAVAKEALRLALCGPSAPLTCRSIAKSPRHQAPGGQRGGSCCRDGACNTLRRPRLFHAAWLGTRTGTCARSAHVGGSCLPHSSIGPPSPAPSTPATVRTRSCNHGDMGMCMYPRLSRHVVVTSSLRRVVLAYHCTLRCKPIPYQHHMAAGPSLHAMVTASTSYRCRPIHASSSSGQIVRGGSVTLALWRSAVPLSSLAPTAARLVGQSRGVRDLGRG